MSLTLARIVAARATTMSLTLARPSCLWALRLPCSVVSVTNENFNQFVPPARPAPPFHGGFWKGPVSFSKGPPATRSNRIAQPEAATNKNGSQAPRSPSKPSDNPSKLEWSLSSSLASR